LEDKIARLCEAPFISDAFGQQEARLRYEEAVREREELRAKVAHLQEAVRTHYSALTTLKQHAAQLREEKEEAEKKAEEMRMKYQELDANTSLLQDKLRLYSGDDGVDIESLERALTLVKRRGEALESMPFRGDLEGENMVMLPVVKRKLEETQLLNLKLTQEVERLESMLKLQSGINRDLHKELEAQVMKRDKDKRDLIQRADDFEEMAMKRLEKIHSLEAQVRQLIYGTAKGRSAHGLANPVGGLLMDDAAQAMANAETGTLFSDGENPLLADLIDERGGDLNPDENLLEVWVKNSTIREGVLAPGSSTFVVIDFFDYESQTTALVSGAKPEWDFAATFKIIVDDFLLRHLAMDVLTLELNMVSWAYSLNTAL
jgi:protein fantom